MMWNNERYPLVGNIAGVREIDAYLRNAVFWRKLLGSDPDEVQEFLAEVSKRYKAIIASLLTLQAPDAQTLDLHAELCQMAQENAGLAEWVAWLKQENASLSAENERLQQENAALCAERAQRGTYY